VKKELQNFSTQKYISRVNKLKKEAKSKDATTFMRLWLDQRNVKDFKLL
jgi:hypothetical protein